MSPSPAAAVAAFARRAWFGAFVAAFARAVLVLALAAAALMVTVRLLGGHLPPQPWWAAAVAPVVAFAWWSSRRQQLPGAAAAAHLDGRLSADGLLVSAHDLLASHDNAALDAVFAARLSTALDRLPQALPKIRWRSLLPGPLLAAAFASAIALMPPPPAPPAPLQRAAVASELERLTESVRDLFERGAVPEDTKEELERKLQEMQRQLAAGDVPEWRDLDQLEQRLERERLLQAAAEPTGAGSASPEVGPDGTAAAAIDAQQLADAAAALAAAGQLDQLPAAMRELLELAQRADGKFAADALPADPAALKALADAMAALAAEPGTMEALAKLDGGQLADLRELLEQYGEGQGAGDVAGEGEGVGRGGVDRGPGHAALSMTEDAEGGADAAMALPPGQPVPTEWVPVGSRRIEPQVDPVRNESAGAAGAAGRGGASWQLQLAPRHRAVVQRYFGALPAGAGKEGPSKEGPRKEGR